MMTRLAHGTEVSKRKTGMPQGAPIGLSCPRRSRKVELTTPFGAAVSAARSETLVQESALMKRESNGKSAGGMTLRWPVQLSLS